MSQYLTVSYFNKNVNCIKLHTIYNKTQFSVYVSNPTLVCYGVYVVSQACLVFYIKKLFKQQK